MKITHLKTQDLFAQAYVLGGSPCSGKSTIAERLSRDFHWQYYKVDDYEREHLERCDPDRHPTMHTYAAISWNEIWMRPVQLQVKEEFAYYRERFEMIAQDLEAYSIQRPLLLEGAAFVPELLERNAANPQRVMFLVSTRAFQLAHYRKRPWIKHILAACDDPEQAFDNWMRRDHLFGQEILRQARAMCYETLLVDGKASVDENYETVKAHFGLE